MVWWAALVLAFGAKTVVTSADGVLVEVRRSVFALLLYAPLVALPWAIVGVVVGALVLLGGRLVAVAACVGVLVGGAVPLLTGPFDGWLSITMPVWCLGSALACALAACVMACVAAIWRALPPASEV
jgi:hypothetical protein